MDLGIAGRRAIVCGSSRGLGRACAEALAAEGVHIVLNGLDEGKLLETAADMRGRFGVEITPVAADVTTVEGQRRLLSILPDPDILINNVGGPPVKPVEEMTTSDWRSALENLLLSAVSMTNAVLPTMIERGFGRIVNITSGQVARPRSEMALSAAPRAALTAVMKGLSQDVVRHNVTINNMMPERFATDRQREHARQASEARCISIEDALLERGQGVAAKRLGRPTEFGATCAFLCGASASYLSGQSLHLDGGTYPGLL